MESTRDAARRGVAEGTEAVRLAPKQAQTAGINTWKASLGVESVGEMETQNHIITI